MADAKTGEAAVRQYLMYLDNPNSLRDDAEIEKLRGSVDSAEDPVARLKAITALKAAEAVDGSVYRDAFMEHAKAWADAEDVPVDSFREMGVPDDDLRAAGFNVTRGRRGTQRRTRVTIDQIQAVVPNGKFTLRQMTELSGASTATVKRAIDNMIVNGLVEDLGPKPDHIGRGRAPNEFQRV